MSKHPLPHQKAIVPQQKTHRWGINPRTHRLERGRRGSTTFSTKKGTPPTTLGLNKKMTAQAEGPPIPPTPISKGKTETKMAPVATPKMCIERQVDHLLMPPPVDTTLIV